MDAMIKLQCPSCGGKLDVAKDLEQFACGYCGSNVMVRRGGGTVSLTPVVEGLANVQRGVDRTAAELAISRLEREIAKLREEANKSLADSKLELAKHLKSSRYAGVMAIIGLLVLPGAFAIPSNEAAGMKFFGFLCLIVGVIVIVKANRQSGSIKAASARAKAERDKTIDEAVQEMARYRSMLKN